MNRKTKIFLITFFSIILISIVVISIISEYNDKKLNDKINDSKSAKILTLNNIDNPITFEELCKIESSQEYTIEDIRLEYENESDKKDYTVTYTNTSFYGSSCIKEYFLVDEKLKICIFTIDTSNWMPKDIYKEITNINGNPDIVETKKDNLGTDKYIWYGKNGTITYTGDNISDKIEIIFELN